MSPFEPQREPCELWVLHKLDRDGHITDHFAATAHDRQTLSAWQFMCAPTAEYPHGRARIEQICPPPTLTEEVGHGEPS